MIDLHLHVLPGVDDGARDLAASREMLELARELGFDLLVATPHLPGPLTADYARRVAAALAESQAVGAELGVEVRQGFEVMLAPDLIRRLEGGEPITLGGGSALLVELPFSVWPLYTEATMFALQTAGYRPVLGHPERYAEVQRNPGLAIALAERGVLLQVNLPSLTGLFGQAARRTAEVLLRAGAVHLAASDAHSSGRRYAAVPAGIGRLRELVGDEGVAILLEETPRALLEGAALPNAPRVAPGATGTGWWERGRRMLRGESG